MRWNAASSIQESISGSSGPTSPAIGSCAGTTGLLASIEFSPALLEIGRHHLLLPGGSTFYRECTHAITRCQVRPQLAYQELRSPSSAPFPGHLEIENVGDAFWYHRSWKSCCSGSAASCVARDEFQGAGYPARQPSPRDRAYATRAGSGAPPDDTLLPPAPPRSAQVQRSPGHSLLGVAALVNGTPQRRYEPIDRFLLAAQIGVCFLIIPIISARSSVFVPGCLAPPAASVVRCSVRALM